METTAPALKRKSWLGNLGTKVGIALALLVLFVAVPAGWSWLLEQKIPGPNTGQLGGPIQGLTLGQLIKFYEAEKIFKHEFTVKEGVGPLFNDRSCYGCHGRPGIVGQEGRDTSSTSILNFARRVPGSEIAKKPLREVIQGLRKSDVDFFQERGGPSLQKKSITGEFPDLFPHGLSLDAEQVPVEAELQSNRHTMAIWGVGLVDQIPDAEMIDNALQEATNWPKLKGRPLSLVDRFTERARASHFGWKGQHVNLLNFTAGALNIEMGMTTFLLHTEFTPTYLGIMPEELRARTGAPNPNDSGKILLSLTYFQSLLAPPPRGEITEDVKKGEKIFKELRCAVCHKPEAHTVLDARVPDPDSPLPNIRWLHIDALSNKTFYPYSDFLLHDMGPDLADGMPQEGARGGEWRTHPLWGVRFKKFLLHDGRARTIEEAILAHGGQAQPVTDEYTALPQKDKDLLMAFLKSL